ncbi:DNA glycosylase/AP lyase Nei [Thiorhodovibrio winogradskyi]|uniref:DNA-(apurinic or apyrimidinic site) lyase n=1 Tax=Thiorhodovibrio winogradskyi TaxID=77007 RepID=A0ABZ0S371_9GAMM|nr:DNA-formamidopyrimidine glycosylase family protein [Thiorhodovibrio winogradskyi]
MPEGDTLFKIAAYLRPELCGRKLRQAVIPTMPEAALTDSRIEAVFARGKHLFITFGNDRILRSHLGMRGSWHAYAPEEPWQNPRQRAGIVLDTGDRVFVCFNPQEVELLHGKSLRQRILNHRIGPDLLDPQIDFRSLPARASCLAAPETPLIDILLDQRIAAGIGNVYKSELLFLAGWHPLMPLKAINDAQLAALYQSASKLLASNTGAGPRITRHTHDSAGILWVYKRATQACYRCNTPIRFARLGRHHRTTFWCPSCQPDQRHIGE